MQNLVQKLKHTLPAPIFSFIRNTYIKTIGRLIAKKNNALVDGYTNSYLNMHGHIVSDGPFKGLTYVTESVGSSFLHKLAGYYEAVLIPYIQKAKELPIEHIVDIGAAEGYYTTGFGSFFPTASMVAFEMEEKGRENIAKLHSMNKLKNPLTILGKATAENVFEQMKPNTLLICDCEGAEKNIFQNPRAEVSNILYGIIELHDQMVPECKDTVIRFFEKTHKVDIIKFTHANPKDFIFLNNLPTNDLKILLKERGIQDQEWAIVTRI